VIKSNIIKFKLFFNFVFKLFVDRVFIPNLLAVSFTHRVTEHYRTVFCTIQM